MAIYLMYDYGNEATRKWFEQEYRASGKKLDMGKSCVRFRKLEDLPLEVTGKAEQGFPLDKPVAPCSLAESCESDSLTLPFHRSHK